MKNQFGGTHNSFYWC